MKKFVSPLFIFASLFFLLMVVQPPGAAGEDAVELFSFDFVELRGRPLHEGLFPIPGQPIIGQTVQALAKLLGPYATAEFSLVTADGNFLQTISMEPTSDSGGIEFLGSFALPDTPFRAVIRGTDKQGTSYELATAIFSPQPLEVRFLSNLPTLAPGSSYRIPVTVKNYGKSGNFRIAMDDTLGVIYGLSASELTLKSGATGTIYATLQVPAGTPSYTEIVLKATATSSTVPQITNSATRSWWAVSDNTRYVRTAIDIKPGTCKNPLNTVARGVLPIVVLGSADLDVTRIDLTSLLLIGGLTPLRSSYTDVGSPTSCATATPDGYQDLVIHFDMEQIVQILGPVGDGDVRPLLLGGFANEGTFIWGEDTVTVIQKP